MVFKPGDLVTIGDDTSKVYELAKTVAYREVRIITPDNDYLYFDETTGEHISGGVGYENSRIKHYDASQPLPSTPTDFAHAQVSGGLRYDTDKLRLELLPAEWELELGRVSTKGAKKYAPRNWEKGMAWSKMIGCSRRHILRFLLGEKYDKETGCHHLAHAAWNLLALMSYDMRKLGENDLPPSVKVGSNFERIEE
jgi:hypothetical protein